MGIVEATVAGIGFGAISCFIGISHPDLRRVLNNDINYRREIWLVTHPEINRSARIRAVSDFLGKALEADAAILKGINGN